MFCSDIRDMSNTRKYGVIWNDLSKSYLQDVCKHNDLKGHEVMSALCMCGGQGRGPRNTVRLWERDGWQWMCVFVMLWMYEIVRHQEAAVVVMWNGAGWGIMSQNALTQRVCRVHCICLNVRASWLYRVHNTWYYILAIFLWWRMWANIRPIHFLLSKILLFWNLKRFIVFRYVFVAFSVVMQEWTI